MVFWGIKKKNSVPDELPDLISDDIEKNSKEVNNFLKENEKKEEVTTKVEVKKEEPIIENKKVEDNTRSSKEIISRLIKNIKEDEDKRTVQAENEKKFTVNDKSFFDELQKNLNKEIGDLSDLENWYEKKFLPRDILSDMRNYWEKQKTESILDLLGKNFQEKIAVKISKLQNLEKEWQSTYFELIEKEEEIKAHEAELKETLREFVEVCKNKKKNLESNDLGNKIKNESKKKEE
jgi:hypothetical protein